MAKYKTQFNDLVDVPESPVIAQVKTFTSSDVGVGKAIQYVSSHGTTGFSKRHIWKIDLANIDATTITFADGCVDLTLSGADSRGYHTFMIVNAKVNTEYLIQQNFDAFTNDVAGWEILFSPLDPTTPSTVILYNMMAWDTDGFNFCWNTNIISSTNLESSIVGLPFYYAGDEGFSYSDGGFANLSLVGGRIVNNVNFIIKETIDDYSTAQYVVLNRTLIYGDFN